MRGYKKRTKDGRIIFIPTEYPKIEKNKLKSLEQLEKEYKSQNTLPKEEIVKGMYGYTKPAESIFQDESGKARRYGASNLLGNSGQVGNPLNLNKNAEAYKKWSKDDENWLTDEQKLKELKMRIINNNKAFGSLSNASLTARKKGYTDKEIENGLKNMKKDGNLHRKYKNQAT